MKAYVYLADQLKQELAEGRKPSSTGDSGSADGPGGMSKGVSSFQNASG
jgi:hypothetical protein